MRPTPAALLLLPVLLLSAACDRSKKELEQTVVRLEAISAEKDSLLQDVLATQQFVADLNTQVARARTPGGPRPVAAGGGELEDPLTPAEARARILTRIEELTTRLNESEERLEASRERLRRLGADNAALKKQFAQLDSTLQAYRGTVEAQRAEIAALSEQVTVLRGENTALRARGEELAAERTQLSESVATLTTERNTVFYVIGTKDALRRQGIIVKKGGILGAGATDIPATTLDSTLFTAIDKTKVLEIALPDPERSYRILSRQDMAALENAPDREQRVRGVLRVRNPERFWSASRFLILVQQ